MRLHVLLADHADGTPIVGELKLPGDMDPYFTLIQALACAAHLATQNQYDRMRKHLVGWPNPMNSEMDTRLDAWILFVDKPGTAATNAPKGKYMPSLTTAAETLARTLLADGGISPYIRRIAGVRLSLDTDDSIMASVQWAWTGSVPDRGASTTDTSASFTSRVDE